MPTLIEQPVRIEAAGNKPKLIDEYIGRVNTHESAVSIARMRSPSGWIEPGQRPDFDEFTVVLSGMLRVEHEGGQFDVHGRAGSRGAAGRMGAIQHAGPNRCRIHRGVPAGVLARDGPPRSVMTCTDSSMRGHHAR